MDLYMARKLMHLKVIGQQDVAHCYVIVGAGGTGARLALLLTRILAPGDAVVVIDQDRVEARNIMRQHFTPADVGSNKAELVAARIQAAMPTMLHGEVQVMGIPTTIQEAMRRGVISSLSANRRRPYRFVVLGCVDNPAARRFLMRTDAAWMPVAERTVDNATDPPLNWQVYLDAGNLLRNGQVCLNAIGLPVQVERAPLLGFPKAAEWLRVNTIGTAIPAQVNARLTFSGIRHYAPSLLTVTEHDVEVEGCGARVDIQTPAINAMAASTMFNLLTAIVDGLPIDTPYLEFSSAPILMAGSPWPALDPQRSDEWTRHRVSGLFPYSPAQSGPSPDEAVVG